MKESNVTYPKISIVFIMNIYIIDFHNYQKTVTGILTISSEPVILKLIHGTFEPKANILRSRSYLGIDLLTENIVTNVIDINGNTLRILFLVRRITTENITTTKFVSHTLLCPMIVLPKTINTKYTNNELHIVGTNMSFSSSYVTVDDESNYQICMEFYMEAVASIPVEGKTNPTKTMFSEITVTISFVCVAASIFCLVVTILIYSLFEKLRTAPGMNNLSLSISLLFANISHSFSFRLSSFPTLCSSAGLITQFSWLGSLMWMHICCLHMFFTFFFNTDRMLVVRKNMIRQIKYLIYSVMLPIFLISVQVSFSLSTQGNIGYGGTVCFMTNPKMLLFTFALPIGMIVLINLALFFVVIYKLHKHFDQIQHQENKTHLSIYTKLSTLTGFSWIFGFLFELLEVNSLGIIFNILTASQGIFIMFAFVMNARVFKMVSEGISRSKSGDND